MTARIIAGDILIAFALIVAVYLALIMRIRMRSAERKGSYLSILKGELLLCGMTVILGLDLRWQIAKRIGHPIPGILWRVVVLCSLAMVLLAAYFTVRVVVCGAEKKAGNCRNAVVLGMALEDGKPTRDLVLRVNTAEEYLKKHPGSVLILTGGKTGNTDKTEAGVMKKILIESGVPEEKIELEEQAATTVENFVNVGRMTGFAEPIALITSNYHMYRSAKIARRAGFTDIIPVPASAEPFAYLFSVAWEVIILISMVFEKRKQED